jgi:hypothetical protein
MPSKDAFTKSVASEEIDNTPTEEQVAQTNHFDSKTNKLIIK